MSSESPFRSRRCPMRCPSRRDAPASTASLSTRARSALTRKRSVPAPLSSRHVTNARDTRSAESDSSTSREPSCSRSARLSSSNHGRKRSSSRTSRPASGNRRHTVATPSAATHTETIPGVVSHPQSHSSSLRSGDRGQAALVSGCSWRRRRSIGTRHATTPTTANVARPPSTTLGTVPSHLAEMPDSKAPISFDEPIKI